MRGQVLYFDATPLVPLGLDITRSLCQKNHNPLRAWSLLHFPRLNGERPLPTQPDVRPEDIRTTEYRIVHNQRKGYLDE